MLTEVTRSNVATVRLSPYTVSMTSKSTRVRHRKKQFLDTYKVFRGCEDCGTQRADVLTFDHRDRSTKNPILKDSAGRRRKVFNELSWRDITTELAHCDVVCRKCHDKREKDRDAANRTGAERYLSERLEGPAYRTAYEQAQMYLKSMTNGTLTT